MSLTNQDRKIRAESGDHFQAERFAVQVAEALHRQYGGISGGVGVVGRLTGANARTVTNWFEAKNGPSGGHLVSLCRHSDEVLGTLLRMAGRTAHGRALNVGAAAQKARELCTLLDELDEH